MELETNRGVKKKAALGAAALTFNQLGIRILGLAGGIILARLLSPEMFGVYAISLSVVAIVAHFSDCGIAIALLRKTEEPTQEELQGFFTLQFILIGILSLGIIFGSWTFQSIGNISVNQKWVIQAVAINFFISTFLSPPMLMLQRNLEFPLISRIEVLNEFLFYSATILAANLEWGVWSFVIGMFLRTFGALCQLTLAYPWVPKFRLHWKVIRPILSFGIAAQGANILTAARQSLGSLMVGFFQGPNAVGYLNWAFNYSNLPTQFALAFRRVNFPLFSCLKDSQEELTASLQLIVRYFLLISSPIVIILTIFIHPIVELVFTAKWNPGIPAVYLFLCFSLLSLVIDPFQSLFIAKGNANLILRFSAIWFIFISLFGLIFIKFFGFLGMAGAYSLGTTLVTILAWNYIPPIFKIGLWSAIAPIFLSAMGMGFLLVYLNTFCCETLVSILAKGVCGGIFYLVLLWAFDGTRLKVELIWMKENLLKIAPTLPCKVE